MSKAKYHRPVTDLLDGKTLEVPFAALQSGDFNLSSLRSALSRELNQLHPALIPEARMLTTRTILGADGQRKLRIWLIEDNELPCYTVVDSTGDESRAQVPTTLGKTESKL